MDKQTVAASVAELATASLTVRTERAGGRSAVAARGVLFAATAIRS